MSIVREEIHLGVAIPHKAAIDCIVTEYWAAINCGIDCTGVGSLHGCWFSMIMSLGMLYDLMTKAIKGSSL